MGLFARFACLRMDGAATDLAEIVRGLLRERNMVETTDAAAAERLILVASAGDGWLMVADHLQELSVSIPDPDGLIAELSASHAGTLIDFIVADGDDLMFGLSDHGHVQSGAAVRARPRGVSQHRQGTGRGIITTERGVATLPGCSCSWPNHLLAEAGGGRNPQRDLHTQQQLPHLPIGFVGHFPAFTFHSRGGAARGLEIRHSGAALGQGLVEPVSARARQEHPTDPRRNREWPLTPERSSQGAIFRMPDLEVPDWVHLDHRSDMRASNSLHDIRVFVDVRALKVGHGEVSAEAVLLERRSAPVWSSYPVTVLANMWPAAERQRSASRGLVYQRPQQTGSDQRLRRIGRRTRSLRRRAVPLQPTARRLDCVFRAHSQHETGGGLVHYRGKRFKHRGWRE